MISIYCSSCSFQPKLPPGFKGSILLLTVMLLNFIGSSSPVAPTYTATSWLATGKVDPQVTLLEPSQTYTNYTVTFSGATLNMSQPKHQGIVSLISFESYSSYEFSFNSSVLDITATSMTFAYRVIGDAYFTLMSFHYACAAYNTDGVMIAVPPILTHECFLCSNLTAVSGDAEQQFNQQNLSRSNTDNSLDVAVFIAGLKFINLYSDTKILEVDGFISLNSDTITHVIKKKQNASVEWVCLSTVTYDRNLEAFGNYTTTVYLGKDVWSSVDEVLTIEDQLITDLAFDSANSRFFGLYRLELVNDDISSGTNKFVFDLNSNGIITGLESNNVATNVSYAFIANKACTGAQPYYNPLDYSCYATCEDGFYDDPNNICQPCHYSCQTCDGPNVDNCTACNSTGQFREVNGSECQCEDNYVENGVAICAPCSDFILQCAVCSSTTFCTDCNYDRLFNNDPSNPLCQCPVNKYFSTASNSCLDFPGCTQASDSTGSWVCSECNATLKFELVSNQTCQCIDSYQLESSSGECVSVCGDGIFTDLDNESTQCDDGNSVDGDGCDSQCLIESGYGCQSNVGEASICAPARTLQMTYLFASRKENSNIAVLFFKVTETDASDELSKGSFNYTLDSSIGSSTGTLKYDSESSILSLQMPYETTIESTTQSISLHFDPYTISISSKSFSLTMQGINYQLTYDDNLPMIELLQTLSTVTGILIVSVFVIMNFADCKLGATELLLSSQLVYFSLFSSSKSFGISGLKGLKYLYGYNELESFKIDSDNYEIDFALKMQAFKALALNLNIILLMSMVSSVLILVFRANVWRHQKDAPDQEFKLQKINKFSKGNKNFNHKQKLLNSQMEQQAVMKRINEALQLKARYLNRVYYTFGLICVLPCIYFFGLQYYAVDLNSNFNLDKVVVVLVSIVAIMICQEFMVCVYQDSENKRPIFYFEKLQPGYEFYPFYLIIIYYLAIIVYTVTMGTGAETYIALFSSLAPLIYRAVCRPYLQWLSVSALDSFYKCIMGFLCAVSLLVLKLASISSTLVCLGILALMLLSVLLSLIRLMVEIYRRRELQENNLNELNSQSSDERSLKDDMSDGMEVSENEEQPQQDEQYATSKPGNQKQTSKSVTSSQNAGKGSKEGEGSGNERFVKEVEPEEEEEEGVDELTRIKKKLRADLKRKRGAVNLLSHSSSNQKPQKQE